MLEYFRLISFTEFQAFEGHLCDPDALYRTAVQLFDLNGTGLIGFGKLWHIFARDGRFISVLKDRVSLLRRCFRKGDKEDRIVPAYAIRSGQQLVYEIVFRRR